MKQTILIFGGLSVAVVLLFQLSKYSLFGTPADNINEFFVVIAGSLFIVIGFLLNRFFYQRKTKTIAPNNHKSLLGNSKLSKQEFNVFSLMAEGRSNLEIAEHLFISESTVKTHVSNILSKLNAKRRTEAIRIGRDLQII